MTELGYQLLKEIVCATAPPTVDAVASPEYGKAAIEAALRFATGLVAVSNGMDAYEACDFSRAAAQAACDAIARQLDEWRARN